MLTLIDNHLVPYWSAIDGYLIADARKGLLGNALGDSWAVLRKMLILSWRYGSPGGTFRLQTTDFSAILYSYIGFKVFPFPLSIYSRSNMNDRIEINMA